MMETSVTEWIVLGVWQFVVSSLLRWIGFIKGYDMASETIRIELKAVLKRGEQ